MQIGSQTCQKLHLSLRTPKFVREYFRIKTSPCEKYFIDKSALNGETELRTLRILIFIQSRKIETIPVISLNAPGTETPLSYPFLELGESPFLIISPLGLG